MNERVTAYRLAPDEVAAWVDAHRDGLVFRYADSPLQVRFDREIALPEDWSRHDRLLFFGPDREIRLRPQGDGFWHGLAIGRVPEAAGPRPPMAGQALSAAEYEIETAFPDGAPLRYKLWGRRRAAGEPFTEERMPGVGRYPIDGAARFAWVRVCRYRAKATGLVEWIRFVDLEGDDHAE
ncbi:MAG: hypothetical protein OZSIB_1620 [Candidatus Ozemobacter sibiricus]|jgi:hypothetical protein|uniref:Uncharacterized protein n=1 Tax=Candidatus Ozemobacter sibiricus TaxID=2268124 RepID=A0A367ZJD2_9BACT|nr:MAG: hypothetical protein OZSIB_1620 [Candidatus Ozemobacter sibiricus]